MGKAERDQRPRAIYAPSIDSLNESLSQLNLNSSQLNSCAVPAHIIIKWKDDDEELDIHLVLIRASQGREHDDLVDQMMH